MGVPQVMGQNGVAGGFPHPAWNVRGGMYLQQQAPVTGGWSQFSPFPSKVQPYALVPENRRLAGPPGTVGKRESKNDTEPKGQQARVRKMSARFPRFCIVKCEAQFGGDRMSVLIDTSAPCCLIDSELLERLEPRGKLVRQATESTPMSTVGGYFGPKNTH